MSSGWEERVVGMYKLEMLYGEGRYVFLVRVGGMV